MKSIALIPARSGSQRIKNKNVLLLEGHPLIAYAIRSAIDSKIFDSVHVCTDSESYASIAISYGATCRHLRPASMSSSTSPDCDWVSWFLDLHPEYCTFDYACILRPTSPFRKPSTIKRAFESFLASGSDTLRAVRPVNEHPAKMWIAQNEYIVPLLPFCIDDVPFHSNQTSKLFKCFVQDASIEIFTISKFLSTRQITGSSILPFFNQGYEGFDINVPADLESMHSLISANVDGPYRFSNAY